MIGRELDDCGITAAIGAILGMPADEATKLLSKPDRDVAGPAK
jgi:hypothetical protein